jgi:hypothetical protein
MSGLGARKRRERSASIRLIAGFDPERAVVIDQSAEGQASPAQIENARAETRVGPGDGEARNYGRGSASFPVSTPAFASFPPRGGQFHCDEQVGMPQHGLPGQLRHAAVEQQRKLVSRLAPSAGGGSR